MTRDSSAYLSENDSMQFQLFSDYEPAGDQPQAIEQLVDGLESGLAHQTLLGVTGSGKTYSIANVIQRVQRPTLVMAHNKTLAAQLYGEFKGFFPQNSVEYFVSYYDYYQPEAYVPASDTFIEKDALDQRAYRADAPLSDQGAARAARTRSSSPPSRRSMAWAIRNSYLSAWCCTCRAAISSTSENYCAVSPTCSTRAMSLTCTQGTYRVRGDVIDVFPAESEREAVRIELFDDTHREL